MTFWWTLWVALFIWKWWTAFFIHLNRLDFFLSLQDILIDAGNRPTIGLLLNALISNIDQKWTEKGPKWTFKKTQRGPQNGPQKEPQKWPQKPQKWPQNHTYYLKIDPKSGLKNKADLAWNWTHHKEIHCTVEIWVDRPEIVFNQSICQRYRGCCTMWHTSTQRSFSQKS